MAETGEVRAERNWKRIAERLADTVRQFRFTPKEWEEQRLETLAEYAAFLAETEPAADTGGERERKLEDAVRNAMALQRETYGNGSALHLAMITWAETIAPAALATPAATPTTPGVCRICHEPFAASGPMAIVFDNAHTICLETQPTPASRDKYRNACKLCGATFRCDNGMWVTTCTCARDKPDELREAQNKWDNECSPTPQPTPAADAGDAESALIEAEPWRQGYVGTFPELCIAYGRVISDTERPLQAEIDKLKLLLGRCAAAFDELGSMEGLASDIDAALAGRDGK